MNIGVLGGTFDPIHSGHLIMAEEARVRLDLARVIFVPASQPQLKNDAPLAPTAQRVEMVRLAVRGSPYFKLSTVEVERAGPSYSVDTVGTLQQQLGKEAQIFFIVGWDSLAALPRWKEPARIIKLCQLVAVNRPGFQRPNLAALEASIPGISARVVWLDIAPVDISSSEIRDRLAKGLSVHGLVPEAVESYIRRKKLYHR
jgi:nicotinate-nucleotide adenylyltransferase